MSRHPGAPSLLSLLDGHWELAWGVDLAAAVYLGLYLWATLRVRRWAPARTLSFAAGVGVVLLALQSGLDAYDDRMLSAHMLQHVLLVMAAPPLLLLGQPVMLALRALPPRLRPAAAGLLARVRRLTRPSVCLAVFAAVLLLAHIAPVFDAAVRHPLLHAIEHLAFLAAGLLLWWPLTDAEPLVRHRLGGLGRIFFMLAAMLPEDLIGAYLNRAGTVVYAPYAGAAHALGISAVLDQQQAGAIMWVGSSCVMAAGGLCAAMAAMVAEERRIQRRELRADAPAPPASPPALVEILARRGPA